MKKYLLLIMSLFALVSCNSNNTSYLTSSDPGTATIRIYKDDSATSKERYISPKNVKISTTFNDLSGVLSNNENVCPSIGDVNLLVIPVHLPDSTFNTAKVKNDIETAFFGKNDPKNAYMSLSEYYYESSFGKLNFDGFVTDWFDVSEHTSVKSLSDITTGSTGTIQTEILRKATDWAFETYNLNRKDFDKNEDGSISVNAEDVAIGYGWSQIKNEKVYAKFERMNKFIVACIC